MTDLEAAIGRVSEQMERDANHESLSTFIRIPDLRLILEAARSTLWLDIKDAPRDGKWFWGKIGEDAIAMRWHDGFGEFVSSWRQMTMAPGYLIDGQSGKDHSPVVHKPSLWMPIRKGPDQ